MTHDYKKALSLIVTYEPYIWQDASISPDRENTNAIRHALELAIALQRKPISEAPRDGRTRILCDRPAYRTYGIAVSEHDGSVLETISGKTWQPTHFYDISALPKPEGD
jgi:hypothetical protein